MQPARLANIPPGVSLLGIPVEYNSHRHLHGMTAMVSAKLPHQLGDTMLIGAT